MVRRAWELIEDPDSHAEVAALEPVLGIVLFKLEGTCTNNDTVRVDG